MVALSVSPRMIAEARQITRGRIRRHGTHRQMTPDTWVGALGEIIFSLFLDHVGALAAWYRDQDLDFDFEIGNLQVDVKTQNRTTAMRPDYACNVAAHQVSNKPGDYFFMSFNQTDKMMYLCGGIPRADFMKKAHVLAAGAYPRDNPLMVAQHDVYHVRQADLLTPETWVETLPAAAWPDWQSQF